jgi:Glycosyltransferase family 28 C-terminal domain
VGLPAAYVPLPHGNGEQRLNALPIVQRGGGLLVDDAELTADWIKASLLPVLTNIDQVAGMSEAAAAMGRKDADRWLAKAVIDAVAAEAANRVAAAGPEPETARQPAPRPAPAPAAPPRPASAPAGQWASPAPQPPDPASAEPGSLFTPRTSRHQQSAGWGQPSPDEQPRPSRGQDAPGPFPPGPFPPGQFPAGQGRPDQLSARPGPSLQPPNAQPRQAQPPRAQPPQAAPSSPGQPLPSRLPPGRPGAAPTPQNPSSGPGRHRQARS